MAKVETKVCDHCGSTIVDTKYSISTNDKDFCNSKCQSYFVGKQKLLSDKFKYVTNTLNRLDTMYGIDCSFRYIDVDDLDSFNSNYTLVSYVGGGEWSFYEYDTKEQIIANFAIITDEDTIFVIFDNKTKTELKFKQIRSLNFL